MFDQHMQAFLMRDILVLPIVTVAPRFNITAMNSSLISLLLDDVLLEIFVNIGIVKQFVIDVNMVLFLLIGQQTCHHFCGNVMHVKLLFPNCVV